MFDQLPWSLGMEIDDNIFFTMIPQNTPLPARSYQSITTISDNQYSIEIHLLKGNSADITKNKTLGRFVLSGLKERERRRPKIDFSILVEPHGLITLKIQDQESQKQLVQILSMESYDELYNLNFQSDDIEHRKLRLKQVIKHLSHLIKRCRHVFDRNFSAEIFENLAIARTALNRNNKQAILEMPLILETLIAEAEAIERACL